MKGYVANKQRLAALSRNEEFLPSHDQEFLRTGSDPLSARQTRRRGLNQDVQAGVKGTLGIADHSVGVTVTRPGPGGHRHDHHGAGVEADVESEVYLELPEEGGLTVLKGSEVEEYLTLQAKSSLRSDSA